MISKQVFLIVKTEDIIGPGVPIRKGMDQEKFDELCESVRTLGLIEPIVIVKKGKKFEIVAGHRRYLACKDNNMKTINCVLIGTKDADIEAVKYAENMVREDVHPIDEAVFMQAIMDKDKIDEYQLADRLGKGKSYVFERLQILKYPDILKAAFLADQVNYSKCRELYKLKDMEGLETYLTHAIESGASCGVIKQWVTDYNTVHREQSVERVEDYNRLGAQEPKQQTVVCECCKAEYSLNDTRIARVCQPCLVVLNQPVEVVQADGAGQRTEGGA